jgi:hypothetical protein
MLEFNEVEEREVEIIQSIEISKTNYLMRWV